MGTESISVVYVHINDLAGKPFYHGTLMYTDSQGQQFFAGGDIGNQSLTTAQRGDPRNVLSGELAAQGIGTSPYGNLVTVQGNLNDPAMAAYKSKWFDSAVGTDVLNSGADLSGQWSKISGAMTEINSDRLPYAPVSQNSNSAWCTAALAAGLQSRSAVPTDDTIWGSHWSPGCTTVLPTSTTTKSNGFSTTEGQDQNGTPDVTLTEKDASGKTLDTSTIGASSSTGSDYEKVVSTQTSGSNQVTVDVSGQGATVTQNGATVTLALGTDAIVAGNSDTVVVQGNNSKLTINGSNDTASVLGANDLTVVNGSNDITQNYGTGDVTDNYGTSDSTYNYGSDEHNFNYGSYDFTWSDNSTDTNYNSNSTDGGEGAGSYGYGGWEPGEGYFGYGGTSKGKNGSGVNIDALVKFDREHGKGAAATLVAQAKSQIDSAIADNSAVVSIGAKWDKKVVTWSLANAGGEFTHRLSADEEKAVQRALDQWSEATGLTFEEVQQAAKADMVFGLGDLDTAESGVLGLAAIKKNDGVISRAIITLEDPALSSVVQSGSGEELYANSDAGFDQVLLHEIGHAVGFGDNIDPTSIENFDLTAANRTLSDADISSAAALYGKTASTGTEIHSAKAVDELVHARLSSNDTAQTAAMYGGEPTAVNVLHQIIHAMSSFAPAPMGSALAANDPDVSGHAMRYGGNYLIRRAN